MALRWDFKAPGGTVTLQNGDVINWYQGNCMMIALDEFKADDGEEHYSLAWFFADSEHAKNCLGLTKDHENIFKDNPFVEITVNRQYCYEWDRMVRILVKAFPDLVVILNK